MKGTVMRPQQPATVATTNADQKSPAVSPAKDQIAGEERPVQPSANRITLALLEEHAAQRLKGYDPYNAGPALAPDAWKQKRKRD